MCDNLDNDCNGLVDDIPVYTYYADTDGDGYGDGDVQLDTCLSAAPAGFVTNNLDCNDGDGAFNPAVAELCDGIDNNCNGLIDDIPVCPPKPIVMVSSTSDIEALCFVKLASIGSIFKTGDVPAKSTSSSPAPGTLEMTS